MNVGKEQLGRIASHRNHNRAEDNCDKKVNKTCADKIFRKRTHVPEAPF